MRDFVLGLSISLAFIVGCLVGGASSSTAVPDASAEGTAAADVARYEYKCTQEATYGAEALAERLNREGRDGWALEGSLEGSLGDLMCFRRVGRAE